MASQRAALRETVSACSFLPLNKGEGVHGSSTDRPFPPVIRGRRCGWVRALCNVAVEQDGWMTTTPLPLFAEKTRSEVIQNTLHRAKVQGFLIRQAPVFNLPARRGHALADAIELWRTASFPPSHIPKTSLLAHDFRHRRLCDVSSCDVQHQSPGSAMHGEQTRHNVWKWPPATTQVETHLLFCF